MKSVQKLKDTEKELRYVVRYIKVSAIFFNIGALNMLLTHCLHSKVRRA